MLLTFTNARLALLRHAAAFIAACVMAIPLVVAGQGGEPAPVRVGGTIKPPMRVRVVQPVYPPSARQSRTQGVVIVETTIGADGKVKATKIVKSIPLLDSAAVAAVSKWEYQPTLVAGRATPVIMTIPVNFKLD